MHCKVVNSRKRNLVGAEFSDLAARIHNSFTDDLTPQKQALIYFWDFIGYFILFYWQINAFFFLSFFFFHMKHPNSFFAIVF